MKVWFETHGEFVSFSVQSEAGEPIILLGRVGKAGALGFLRREKNKLIKNIPKAFDEIIKNVKQGILNEEEIEIED